MIILLYTYYTTAHKIWNKQYNQIYNKIIFYLKYLYFDVNVTIISIYYMRCILFNFHLNYRSPAR